MPFDRKTFFDTVRETLFAGEMSQRQVDGMEGILSAWEKYAGDQDTRWLAYMLGTAYHETAQQMWPIEEYGKGEGHEYGETDPETGQVYYGRGLVQVTWRENYERTDRELGLILGASTVWHADNMLDVKVAAGAMYFGMRDAWFRAGHSLPTYFSGYTDDPFNARDIINGDKNTVPEWAGGVSIGYLIERYHYLFLDALEQSETLV